MLDEEHALLAHVGVKLDAKEDSAEFHFIFEEDAVQYAVTHPKFAQGVLETLRMMHDQFQAHVAHKAKGEKYDA